MKVIKPSYEILTEISPDAYNELKLIEQAGRICYKSEDRISQNNTISAKKLISSMLSRGHETPLEHSILSVKFIVDRGVTHELVRHRLASFNQESTRYCAYDKDKFGNEITYILPPGLSDNQLDHFKTCCSNNELDYFKAREDGLPAEIARDILLHSVKTEIILTANYREWRHIFKLRCSKAAHPQIREVMCPLLLELKSLIPVIFDDLDIVALGAFDEDTIDDVVKNSPYALYLNDSELSNVAYICDHNACPKCTPDSCSYTTNIKHAINFKGFEDPNNNKTNYIELARD